MPLDTNKLENTRRQGDGKVVARCPACAAEGRDETGNHLVVYPDGRFGCVANPQNTAHRKAIFKLCGVVSDVPRQPKAIEIRPKSAPKRGVGVVLGRFGRVFQTSFNIVEENKHPYIKVVGETRPSRPNEQPPAPMSVEKAMVLLAAGQVPQPKDKAKKSTHPQAAPTLACTMAQAMAFLGFQKAPRSVATKSPAIAGADALELITDQPSAKETTL